MAKNDEAYEELAMRKKTLGERLTELMNYRGYERTSIRKAYKEKFGLDIQRQTFAKYQKGEVHLPKDIAENISQILDYDSGYLLGKDRCFCKTYAEYQQLCKRHIEEVPSAFEGMKQGEIIEALFPIEGIYKDVDFVEVVFKGEIHTTYFTRDFWDSPYKGVSE